MNEEQDKVDTIPAPPLLPSFGPKPVEDATDPLTDIARRLGELSDALHSPDGLIHRLFAEAAEREERRFNSIMTALAAINKTVTDIADAQLEASSRIGPVEEKAEVLEAQLKLVTAHRGNGNGTGHR